MASPPGEAQSAVSAPALAADVEDDPVALDVREKIESRSDVGEEHEDEDAIDGVGGEEGSSSSE